MAKYDKDDTAYIVHFHNQPLRNVFCHLGRYKHCTCLRILECLRSLLIPVWPSHKLTVKPTALAKKSHTHDRCDCKIILFCCVHAVRCPSDLGPNRCVCSLTYTSQILSNNCSQCRVLSLPPHHHEYNVLQGSHLVIAQFHTDCDIHLNDYEYSNSSLKISEAVNNGL